MNLDKRQGTKKMNVARWRRCGPQVSRSDASSHSMPRFMGTTKVVGFPVALS